MPEPTRGSEGHGRYARFVQRRALGILFLAIALALLSVAVWSAAEGGRAWVVAVAAAGLGLWMGDLARRALRR
jgi:hypothetical protein